MSAKDDGGPAYPVTQFNNDAGEREVGGGMSRYEITDDGKLIRIGCPDGCMETLRPTEPDVGVYLDDIVIAAIRQQQSDLAALTAELNDCITDRARIAAQMMEMTAERDSLRATLTESMRQQAEEVNRLRARLDAIDAAPIVALTFCHPHSSEDPGQLILRPAKDGR